VSESYLALQVVMMPRDANPLPTVLPGATQNFLYMTIFGGVILSYIDQAGAIGARREVIQAGAPPPFLVTVAMNRVEFHQPVLVGDVVRFLTRLVRLGRTSITVHVSVEAERGREVLKVTEAEVVYVGIDPTSSQRRPKPLLGDKP
jgi:acyl-CoA thioesterase YciA